MTKRSCQARQPARRVLQMAIAFPTRGPSGGADERSEIVALLSRLLLQVARAQSEREASDDAS
jgi:hypothetical protein